MMAFLASTPMRKQLPIILALRYEAVNHKYSDLGKSVAVTAEMNKVLNEFVDGLTASDEHIRHEAVASVLAVSRNDWWTCSAARIRSSGGGRPCRWPNWVKP
jgi:hypothetical protein